MTPVTCELLRPAWLCLVLFVLLTCDHYAVTRAQAPQTAPAVSTPAESLPQQVARLFEELNAAEWQVRAGAEAEVANLPADALPLLEKLLRDNDASIGPEAHLRLERAIVDVRQRAGTAHLHAERRKQWFDYEHQCLVDGYERFGRHDPRWDVPVRRAMALQAQLSADDAWDDIARVAELFAALQQAHGAGCDDGMVTYLWTMTRHRLNSTGDDERAALDAGPRLRDSGYPAGYCVCGLINLVKIVPDLPSRPLLEGVMSLLPKIQETEQMPFRRWFELCRGIAGGYVTIGEDRLAAWKRARQALGTRIDHGPLRAFPAVMDGTIRWEYSQNEIHDNIAKPNQDPGRAEIEASTASFENALKLEPDNSWALLGLIQNEVFSPSPDRAKMEDWFKRAMTADPENYDACLAKLNFLRAEGRQAMIEFGSQCLETGNFDSKLPLIAVQVYDSMMGIHQYQAYYSLNSNVKLRKPEIWKQISTAFEGYLRRHPTFSAVRNDYARHACWAGLWEVADRQFALIGADAKPDIFGGQRMFEAWKAEAHDRATRHAAIDELEQRQAANVKFSHEFYRRFFLESYDRFGVKDPKWDQAAHKALELWAGDQETDPGQFVDANDLLNACKAAQDSGCKDPLIAFECAFVVENNFAVPDEHAPSRLWPAAVAMQASSYPAPLKVYAATWGLYGLRADNSVPIEQRKQEARALFDQAITAVPEIVRDQWPSTLSIDVLPEIWVDARWLGLGRAGAYEKILAVAQAAVPNTILPLLLRGSYSKDCGMELIDKPYLSELPAEKLAAMKQHMADAEAAFEAAWQLDPNDPAAPTAILTPIRYGHTKKDIDLFEVWFHRAMEADPSNFAACKAKTEILESIVWGETDMSALYGFYADLSHAAGSGRDRAVLGLAISEGLTHISTYWRGVRTSDPDPGWFQKSKGVEFDATNPYAVYLHHFPNATKRRSEYARVLCWCRDWTEANEQFKILGNNARVKVFGSKEKLESMRVEAEKNASVAQ